MTTNWSVDTCAAWALITKRFLLRCCHLCLRGEAGMCSSIRDSLLAMGRRGRGGNPHPPHVSIAHSAGNRSAGIECSRRQLLAALLCWSRKWLSPRWRCHCCAGSDFSHNITRFFHRSFEKEISDWDQMRFILIHYPYVNPKALNYSCINHGDQRVFTIWKNQFEIIINVLVSFFEYLCYVSTVIINMFTLSVRGPTLNVRIWRLQTSDSDV